MNCLRELRVEFSENGKCLRGIGGKEGLDPLSNTVDIGVKLREDFFILLDKVVFVGICDERVGKTEDCGVSEMFWGSGTDFGLVRENWDREVDHREESLVSCKSR